MPLWRPPLWRDTGPRCGAIIVITIITDTTAIIGTTGVTIITIVIITTTITTGTTGAITTTVIAAEPIRNKPAVMRAAGFPKIVVVPAQVRRRRA